MAEAKATKQRAARSRSNSSSSNEGVSVSGNKRDREVTDEMLKVEADLAVFSQGCNADPDSRRTGRWTDDEVTYSDELIKAFDNGQLPIPHGTKLASFLCDALQCKASRLTKKMKNAKLSVRSFALSRRTLETNVTVFANVPFSALQEHFIASMNADYTQLELGFNLTVHWRTMFSDLCVQVGYPFLDTSDFITTLEEYERLGSAAEESMRNARRRRMTGSFGVSSSPPQQNQPSPLASPSGPPILGLDSRKSEFYPEPIDVSVENLYDESDDQNPELFAQSLADVFDDDNLAPSSAPYSREESPINASSLSSHNPFMGVIAEYLESQDLPFQHADTWVPSLVDGSETLIHAGAVTRRDQDGERWSAFESFGEYSRNFTFVPGTGLVGRVFTAGQTMWEHGINKLDPEFFLRAGGAEEYGVRTAVGIPLASGTGRMVVVLYSCNHIPEDILMAQQFENELSQYAPAPKWKLVVDVSNVPSFPRPKKHSNRNVSAAESTSSNQGNVVGLDLDVTEEQADEACFVSPMDTQCMPAEESEIVALIGDHLGTDSESAFEDPEQFQHLLRMRLVLLRPSRRRSTQENDRIEILCNSYKNYTSGNKFNGRNMLLLLAQEWKCLSQMGDPYLEHQAQGSPFAPSMSPPTAQYQAHSFPSSLAPLGASAEANTMSKNDSTTTRQSEPSTPRAADMIVYDHSLNGPSNTTHEIQRIISCSTAMSSHGSNSSFPAMTHPVLQRPESFGIRR